MEKKKVDYAGIGRLGGLKGGKVRAERLSPERRREIAAMGGKAKNKRVGTLFDEEGKVVA